MPSRILRLWNPDAAAWEEVGDSRLSAHLAAADPHPVYLSSSEGEALYVNVTGDTLTGGLTAPTLTVAPAATTAVARVYGAASGAITTIFTNATWEIGVRFRSAVAGTLTEVRWYRASNDPVPSQVRLWDTTATSAPIWTALAADLAPFAVPGTAWKTAVISNPPSLVAGRDYVLSRGQDGFSNDGSGYTPTPDAPLTFVGHVQSGTQGAYPSNARGNAALLDAGVTATFVATPPATTGALRLPNANAGAVAWRNAGSTADLALTVSASNALTFNGTALLTQTTGDAAYLKLTGGTLTGNLGVGVAPAGWGSGLKAVQVGALGALHGGTTYTVLSDNTYNDGAASRTLATGTSSLLVLTGGAVNVQTAPSVAAGAAQTFTTRLQVAQSGTVTLTPDAGQPALTANGEVRVVGGTSVSFINQTASGYLAETYPAGELNMVNNSGAVKVQPQSGIFAPTTDNGVSSGHTSLRWTYVAAVAGAINTSLAEAKQDITPLSPEDALAAVRATDPVLFDYKPPERGPEWYELPDDPEQATAVLEQRMRAAPLEEGARHQAGFVLQDDTGTYATDPLFETGPGQSNSANSAGILLAAIQALDSRLTALEGV